MTIEAQASTVDVSVLKEPPIDPNNITPQQLLKKISPFLYSQRGDSFILTNGGYRVTLGQGSTEGSKDACFSREPASVSYVVAHYSPEEGTVVMIPRIAILPACLQFIGALEFASPIVRNVSETQVTEAMRQEIDHVASLIKRVKKHYPSSQRVSKNKKQLKADFEQLKEVLAGQFPLSAQPDQE